ncbi:MAG: class I SAM-dependent methyltransferase [Pseudomonadota bacterium]
MIVPAQNTPSAPRAEPLREAAVRAVAEKLSVDGDSSAQALIERVLAPVKSVGNSFFDAEEELFLERFAITNFEPLVQVEQLYPPASARRGTVFHVAVRIKNLSEFPIESAGEFPLLLSYHWLRRDEMVVFEGQRTALPRPVPPGREITVPITVKAPDDLGQHELKVLAVQEGVAWQEDTGMTRDIEISRSEPPSLPDLSNGREFSEVLDDKIAAEFSDGNLQLPEKGVVIEIGGGIRTSFRRSRIGANWTGTFVNCDVSIRLLQIASLLAREEPHPTLQVRLDANAMPIRDGFVDAVFISRAIHHFVDLNQITREIFRVLKPGGQLFLLCEPVGAMYDDFTLDLIERGVNEQVFPKGVYERILSGIGFELDAAQCDWGFSFKGAFRKPL